MLKIFRRNYKGFTLLELLVVVLIIGILAGIALPQYRKAVAKAELAQIVNAVKAISNAQERYFLAHNSYAGNMKNLDVNIQLSNGISCGAYVGYALCYNKNFALVHYFVAVNSNVNLIECYARNEVLATACENLFNKKAGSSNNGPCLNIGGKPCYALTTTMPM